MNNNEIKKLLKSGKGKSLKKRVVRLASGKQLNKSKRHQEELAELLNGSQLPSKFKVINFGMPKSSGSLGQLLPAGQVLPAGQGLSAGHGLSQLGAPLQHVHRYDDEMLQCIPSTMEGIHHGVSRVEDELSEMREMLKGIASSVDETNLVVKGSDENLKDLSKKVSTGLDKLGKSISSIRSHQPSGINIIIYYVCAYYKILFAVTRLALEFIWLLSNSGYQWASALPFWGLCIPHIIITYFSYLMYSLTVQGGIFLLTPPPLHNLFNLYPYIFNENMALHIMSNQAGNLIRSAGLGLWRVRALTEPTDRALRSAAAGLLAINNESSVASVILSYVRVPFEFLSNQVVRRVLDGIRENAPSIPIAETVSGAASAVGSGLSGAASVVGSGLSGAASTVGTGITGAASVVGSGLSGAASAVGSGLSGAAASVSSKLPGLPDMSWTSWRGTGGAVLHEKLQYNKHYPLTDKTFDLTMFDKELDSITFLNEKEKEIFNNTKTGKLFNKLSITLDKLLTKQLNVIVKYDEIRVSIYLVVLEKMVNFIESNIPTFKKGFNNSLKPYSLVLKNKIELIDHHILFPELLTTDPITPIYPTINSQIRNKSKSINPSHFRKYLKNTTRTLKQ
jgi:hypothetical protein